MLKALRYRLFPTKAQASQLARTLETCRQVYNSLVNDRKFQYKVRGKSPSWIEQKRSITAWKHKVSHGKPDHPELSDVHSQVLQDVSKRIDLAFQAFFRRVKKIKAKQEKPQAFPASRVTGTTRSSIRRAASGSSRANSACPRLAIFPFVYIARLTA